jgi:hypothetical protein
MSRRTGAQLNIRSDFARDRVREIMQRTGMTATEVVEEALRSYVPPPQDPPPYGLIREGPLLVLASRGRTITQEEADAALEAARIREDL